MNDNGKQRRPTQQRTQGETSSDRRPVTEVINEISQQIQITRHLNNLSLEEEEEEEERNERT